jgi:hypothetical protein
VPISRRGKGEQAPYSHSTAKGGTAEAHLQPVRKVDWDCGEDPQDCHGLTVERSLG